MPKDRLWTSKDEEVAYPSWLALPGGEEKLGLGRYWHFTSLFGWTLAGPGLFRPAVRDRPVAAAGADLLVDRARRLARLRDLPHLPPAPQGTTANPLAPYNALQQLSYFGVVFWLTPHMILTGLAMSPAIESRARWYPKLFFGRQPARSLHFLGMAAYLAFFAVHLLMVVVHGPARELTKMVLGAGREGDAWLGLALGLAIVAAVVLIHAGGHTRLAARSPARPANALRQSSTRPAAPCYTTSSRSRTTPSRRSPLTSASTAIPPPKNTLRPATRTTSGSSRAVSPTGGSRSRGWSRRP